MTDPTARDLIQQLANDLELWLEFCGPPTLPQEEDESFLLLQEARAYLAASDGPAEPDGREPTDEELFALWQELYRFHDGATSSEVAVIARAVLARWGGRCDKTSTPVNR